MLVRCCCLDILTFYSSMDEFTDLIEAYSMWEGRLAGARFTVGQLFGLRLLLMLIPPEGDWPYPYTYVNATIEELAPTHREHFIMVSKVSYMYTSI
jgi:hypothetical protein